MRYPQSTDSEQADPTAEGLEHDQGTLIEEALGGFYFSEPSYREFLREHLAHVVDCLSGLEMELSPTNVVAHIPPKLLESLSHELSGGQGARLRGYLEGLADWLVRYLDDYHEFLHETLRERDSIARRVSV